ncbi:hypothetical protein EIN_498110 [Entamoeba invadens IP1]|uniref:TLDc domain-containing protein n=1 Tax=Entamoeba invadens IP1 TaxID=370355 RepID=A0A0A1UDI9_ENTIV|nr:hypothetical protein EIN_498110 [Entamoeba invadens IP1]ELP94621.1 hypothetical protein EIN_498110 [Entamoeba invadens IP1]|eukprot:XP_004261392.1 hypothetical protein EIN_498110 [Entamoeba invadens IP1]
MQKPEDSVMGTIPDRIQEPIPIDFDAIIQSNISTLKRWTPFESFERIYDSKSDKSMKSFVSAVMNKEDVYVIVHDTRGNVFGGYTKKPIVNFADQTGNTDNFDDNHYIFVLLRNGKDTQPKMFTPSRRRAGFYVYTQGIYWFDMGNHDGRLSIATPGYNGSYNRNLNLGYTIDDETAINGDTTLFQIYTVARIIVLKITS